MAEQASAGRCARHAEATAIATCPRCGDHTCDACWDREDALCIACRVEHGSRSLAYESRRLAVLATLRDVLREPAAVFSRVPPRGRPLRALEVAALAWATPVVALVLLVRLRSDRDLADPHFLLILVQATATGALCGVLASIVHAVLLWSASRLFTPRSASAALRAAAYGQCGIVLLGIAALALVFPPYALGGALVLIGLATFALHQANAFGHFLRGRHGGWIAPRLVGGLVSMAWVPLVFALTIAWRA
ncbi:MAG: hypothetical protein J0L92_16710 [Deltaproteobacteria bacterium]|nr:hypothetical protein [Deltaproteobacteria bacterium]